MHQREASRPQQTRVMAELGAGIRLLGFGREFIYVSSLRCSNLALARKCCFDVNWSFSSMTIVFPHDRAFSIVAHQKSRVAALFHEEDGPGGCTFTSRNCSTDNSAPRLRSTAHSAQIPGQAAYVAKNSANERIDFSLSSRKPLSSSSLTLPSYRSLPNTCVNCE